MMVKTAEAKKRNMGIEALRILAMFMIVMLHVLGQGGILSGTASFSAQHNAAWLLETAAYCAVNCYVLISGYVGLNSSFRYSRLVRLWLQMIFYTILITAAFALIHPEMVTFREWFNAVFPIMTGQYWYMTAYFGMFFLTPFMNMAVNHMEKRQLYAFLMAGFLFYSLVPCILQQKPFTLSGGYSMMWLCILYLAGASIRKCGLAGKIRKQTAAIGYLACILLSWGVRIVLEMRQPYFFDEQISYSMLIRYVSPTIVLAAVFLLLLFAQLDFKNKMAETVISHLAPATLGVYIIHTHPLLWDNCMKGLTAFMAQLPAPGLVMGALLAAVGIYLLCSAVDMGRIRIFKALGCWGRRIRKADA